MRHVARYIVPLAVTGLFAAGCGGGSQSAASSQSSVPNVPATTGEPASGVDLTHLCSLVSPDELGTMLAATITDTSEESDSCEYYGRGNEQVVGFELDFKDGQGTYDMESGPAATPVTGIGDSAFRPSGATGSHVVAIKDGVILNLGIVFQSVDDATVAKLANLIFQRAGA